MSKTKTAAQKVALILKKDGFTYNQTKTIFKEARIMAGLKVTPPNKGAKQRLTKEESDKFIQQAYSMSGKKGLMVQVLLETGCRVGEFIKIRIEDISFQERLIIVNELAEEGEVKLAKRREVPIRDDLAKKIRIYIADRKAGYLFQSREKLDNYTRQRIYQIVKEVAQSAGIQKRVYPHLLRHSMASFLLNNGMAMEEVQLFLGHESISTTQQIYAKMQTKTMHDAFDRATE